MTYSEMESLCIAAHLDRQHWVTLTLPKNFKGGAGWPRGELMSVNAAGERNYRFDPLKLLAWMRRDWIDGAAS